MWIPLAGFVAGLHHVATGPDHLAAVAPLAVTERRSAWRGGLHWALGHAGGVTIIAVIAIALRESLPFSAATLSAWSERLVGVVLVAIGLWGIRKALAHRFHTHVHEHDGQRHLHVHVHQGTTAHGHASHAPHEHSHAALAVGTLHGLAGGSHLVALVPVLGLDTRGAILYLGGYGLGTVAAMVGFASILGAIAQRAGESGTRWARGLMMTASLAAIALGITWLLAADAVHA